MAGMTAEGDVDRDECTAANEEDEEESGRRRWSRQSRSSSESDAPSTESHVVPSTRGSRIHQSFGLFHVRLAQIAPYSTYRIDGIYIYIYYDSISSGFAHLRRSIFPVFGQRISSHETGSIVAPRTAISKPQTRLVDSRVLARTLTCLTSRKNDTKIVPRRSDIVAPRIAQRDLYAHISISWIICLR